MKKSDLLLIIVPYRNRPVHLQEFLQRVWIPLRREHAASKLLVAEQSEGNLFNRGCLLNTAYKWCINTWNVRPRRVVFHDVDLIPCKNLRRAYVTCSAPVVHFGSRFRRYIGKNYFGGVTAFAPHVFEDVGGFPNKFWGWGGEDDALLRRTRAQGYAITWPRFGSYEDLERLTLQQKLQQLRTDKAKCMTKRELMALEPNSQDTLAQTPLCKALRIDKHVVQFQLSNMSIG